MDAQTKKVIEKNKSLEEANHSIISRIAEMQDASHEKNKGFAESLRKISHQKSAALSKCKSYRVVIHDLKEVVKTQKEINDELLDKVSDLEKKFAGARGRIDTLGTTNWKIAEKANHIYRKNKYLLIEAHSVKLLIESIKWYNKRRKLQEVWNKLSKMLEES